MVGIIDVGGGLRDIYGAGVFDRLLDDGVQLDYCLGVSAGSANVASYLAKQLSIIAFTLSIPNGRNI